MKLVMATTAGALIVAFAAFWFMPGGALAMGCAGQMVKASFYGLETCHGRPPGHGKGTCHTASDLPFNGHQMIVAHRSLPFGTRLRLSYHGKSIIVPVQDRGPYVAGRTLDLSRAVASYLGTIPAGVATICMERIS